MASFQPRLEAKRDMKSFRSGRESMCSGDWNRILLALGQFPGRGFITTAARPPVVMALLNSVSHTAPKDGR